MSLVAFCALGIMPITILKTIDPMRKTNKENMKIIIFIEFDKYNTSISDKMIIYKILK